MGGDSKVYINLIKQFTKREVSSRYKNSYLGIFWSFLTPIFMLSIYAFVFTEVFQSKWGAEIGDNNKASFAMMLFAGLLSYQVFSESISKSPNLILQNPNYVKKVIFPLQILPVTNVLSSLIHSIFGFLILIIFSLFIDHSMNWTVVFLPVMLIPLFLFTLGVSYILASLGVFIRDIGHTIGIILNALFFLTPIFYPITAVPERFQIFMRINPLSTIIEDIRSVVLLGQVPNWSHYGMVLGCSILLVIAGYLFFMKSRRLFNDVL